MSRPSLGTDRPRVPFSAVPLTRAWVALSLLMAGVALALSLGLALGERAFGLRRPLSESVLGPLAKQLIEAN